MVGMRSPLRDRLSDHDHDHDHDPEPRPCPRQAPRAEHPVVRVHPVTGRKAIFVNSVFTTRIEGLTATESDALLRFLFEHIKDPNFQVRFRWEENSVAMWDNRCTQHLAVWDYFPQERRGIRVTVCGDRPRGPAARLAAR